MGFAFFHSRGVLLGAGMLGLWVLVPRLASACPEKDYSPCEASSEREAWVERRFDAAASSGSTGARVSITRLQGSDADDTGRGMGLSLAGHAERYAAYRDFSIREASFAFLGGGSLGLEGGIGMDVAAGLRLPFSQGQGPVVRLGMRGYLLGNDKLYESLLEVPQLQIGYQFLQPRRLVEVAGRVGPVLAGRFNTGDETERKLGKAFEVGGHASVHWSVVHLAIQHTHVLMDGQLADVDLLSGRLCGDAWRLELCVDTRVGWGGATVRGGGDLEDPVVSMFGGLVVGFSDRAFQTEPRDPRRKKRPGARQPAVLAIDPPSGR